MAKIKRSKRFERKNILYQLWTISWCEVLIPSMMSPGLIILLTVFIGCNPYFVNKDVTPLIHGNDEYTLSVEGIEPESRWWEALNDRFLDALIMEALSENLTLTQARARIEQAIAADKQARSFLYPEVSGRTSGDSVSRYKENLTMALPWD